MEQFKTGDLLTVTKARGLLSWESLDEEDLVTKRGTVPCGEQILLLQIVEKSLGSWGDIWVGLTTRGIRLFLSTSLTVSTKHTGG